MSVASDVSEQAMFGLVELSCRTFGMFGFTESAAAMTGRWIYARCELTIHAELHSQGYTSATTSLLATMADMDATSEPVFRANKRRKVFRKRADSEAEDEGRNKSAETGNEPDEAWSKGTDDTEDLDEGSALRLQKRPGTRKLGIGFSSTEGRKTALQEDNAETALVPISQDAAPDVQIDRFVRPMGREMVTEDKNMYVSAYP